MIAHIQKGIAFLLLLLPIPVHAQIDFSLENTNILFFQEDVEDSNKLRFTLHYSPDSTYPLNGILEIDYHSTYLFRDDSSDHDIEIYRGYVEYQGEKVNVKAGKQRMPFGVGRIWNPTDIFNPIDITSPEPQEREGTDSILLEYTPTALSSFDAVLADQRSAYRFKTYYKEFDIGALFITDDENDILVLGWEFEGQLLRSGIDIRSEGGYFNRKEDDESYVNFILGAEYGFPYGISLLIEYNYDDFTHIDQFASRIFAQLTPLLHGSVLAIFSLDDHSRLFSTGLEYSLSDEMNLHCGVFIYTGDKGELFSSENLLFLRWFVHF